MKKIWNDEEASTLVRLLFITLVSVLVIIIGVYSFFYTEDEPEPRDDRTWTISVEDDHYLIEIFKFEYMDSLDEVSWAILDLQRLVTTWDDPFGDTLRMEGDLIDINFSQSAFNGADTTDDNTFYSRDPAGTPPVSINHTLCIVYFDEDDDGKLSRGDHIRVRPIVNGGCAMEDYRFRMVNERVCEGYGELLFPAFP